MIDAEERVGHAAHAPEERAMDGRVGGRHQLLRRALQILRGAHDRRNDRLKRTATTGTDVRVLAHLSAPVDLERRALEREHVQRRGAVHVALSLPLEAHHGATVGTADRAAVRAGLAAERREREEPTEKERSADVHDATLASEPGLVFGRGMLMGMTDCSRCTRRTALVGIGALALGAALPGCAAKTSLPMGSASSCTGGLCLDLTAAANAPLRMVGGAVLVPSAGDRIAVVRTSDTQIAALSAICTHEGCINEYDASAHSLDCPCHGSSFALTGAVLAGPARAPLRTYAATISGDVITIAGA